MTFDRVTLAPHSWDAPAPAAPDGASKHDAVREVLGHIERMEQRSRPGQYSELQWHVLLKDLRRFAMTHLEQALAAGWALLDLYGSPPRHNGRCGLYGVALLLGGREITSIDSDRIVIANHTGASNVWRKEQNGTAAPHKMAGARLVWMVPIERENA